MVQVMPPTDWRPEPPRDAVMATGEESAEGTVAVDGNQVEPGDAAPAGDLPAERPWAWDAQQSWWLSPVWVATSGAGLLLVAGLMAVAWTRGNNPPPSDPPPGTRAQIGGSVGRPATTGVAPPSDPPPGTRAQIGGSVRRPATTGVGPATSPVGPATTRLGAGANDVTTATGTPPPSAIVQDPDEKPPAPAELEMDAAPTPAAVTTAAAATDPSATETSATETSATETSATDLSATAPSPADAASDPPGDDRPLREATVAQSTDGPDGVAPPVDVQARLADRVRQIDFDQIAIIDLIDFLVQLTRVPITLDLDSLERVGVHAMDRVSIHEQDTTVAQLLSNALTRLSLTYSSDDRQIVVVAPETGPRVVRYRVEDLLEKTPVAGSVTTLEAFAEQLRQLVAPTTWTSAGGGGTIAVRDECLQVDQSPDVHNQILTFCERLRVARRLPLRSRLPSARFSLVSRRTGIQEKLEQPITFTYVEPVPIAQLVQYLRKATGLAIAIDWRLLSAQDLTPDVGVSCSVVDRPLGDALSAVLGPIGLAWRATAAKSIQIITAAAAEQHLEIEFYPVASTAGTSVQPTRLPDEIRGSIAADSWTGTGGAGVVVYDPGASQLIVLQTQAVQAQVEHWINRRLAAQTAP